MILPEVFPLAPVWIYGKSIEDSWTFSPESPDESHVIGVVLEAFRQNTEALDFATQKLRGDRALMSLAVQKDGLALRFASAELQAVAWTWRWGERGTLGVAYV